MEQAKEKKGIDWKSVLEVVKDGVELAEKVVGGKNALIAGAVGLAVGFGLGAAVSSPSDTECAEFIAKKEIEDKEFMKRLTRKSYGW